MEFSLPLWARFQGVKFARASTVAIVTVGASTSRVAIVLGNYHAAERLSAGAHRGVSLQAEANYRRPDILYITGRSKLAMAAMRKMRKAKLK